MYPRSSCPRAVRPSPRSDGRGPSGGVHGRPDLSRESIHGVTQSDEVGTVTQHTPAHVRYDIAHRGPEDPRKVGRGRPLSADAGREERTVDVEVVRREVAQGGADDRPEGAQRLLPAFSAARCASIVAPTSRPSARTACWTSPPSGFEVSASTNSPAPLSRADATAGERDP